MSTTVTEVTAADVRAFYRAKPERMARLSDEARATVEPGARGRLHPEAEQDHNTRRRGKVYVLGKTGEVSRAAKADAKAAREALRAQGVTVGTRGPLPKSVTPATSKA